MCLSPPQRCSVYEYRVLPALNAYRTGQDILAPAFRRFRPWNVFRKLLPDDERSADLSKQLPLRTASRYYNKSGFRDFTISFRFVRMAIIIARTGIIISCFMPHTRNGKKSRLHYNIRLPSGSRGGRFGGRFMSARTHEVYPKNDKCNFQTITFCY